MAELVAQQRLVRARFIKEDVYAAGVRLEHRAGLIREVLHGGFLDRHAVTVQINGAVPLVDGNNDGGEAREHDLVELAAHEATAYFHLDKAVARMDIAERCGAVGGRRAADARDAFFVDLHTYAFAEAFDLDRAFGCGIFVVTATREGERCRRDHANRAPSERLHSSSHIPFSLVAL